MVGIVVGSGTTVRLVGHGLKVAADFLLAPGVTVSPFAPVMESSFGSRTVGELRDTINAMALEGLADFSLLIEHDAGGKSLAAKAWNALWDFGLLALACRSPVMPLYSVADNPFHFSPINRNLVLNPLPRIEIVLPEQLHWASQHYDRFGELLRNDRFQAAQRYFNNAHYLFDDDAKIMLLWAGIEGLLDVDAELRRRIALHAAILHDGDPAEKEAYLAKVKKGYDVRSKVVHGAGADSASLKAGYRLASDVLINLLRKMVELGRVPSAAELDQLAASASLR